VIQVHNPGEFTLSGGFYSLWDGQYHPEKGGFVEGKDGIERRIDPIKKAGTKRIMRMRLGRREKKGRMIKAGQIPPGRSSHSSAALHGLSQKIPYQPIDPAPLDVIHAGITHHGFHPLPVIRFIAVGGTFFAFRFGVVGAFLNPRPGVVQ